MRWLLGGILLILAMVAPAQAATFRGVELDPRGQIRPQLLEQALASYERHQDGRLTGAMMIVDYSKRSSEQRLYLLDLRSGTVRSLLVAHGQGSDRNHDGLADFFSNEDGSHASSLGAYRAAERYQGGHGLSLRLDGLDATNRSARARAIVLHSQWYVSPQIVAQRGVLGRSWGCFVVERGVIEDAVDLLENGGFVYAGR
ncbi:MAG: murein L,D-transpeptidase catalytic domain family protein [Vitreimonas sp.]